MSHTLALYPVKKRDAIFLWILLGWLAFALLPSWSLDYGLLRRRAKKFSPPTAGHSSISVGSGICCQACCWCARSMKPDANKRSRHYFDAGWAFFYGVYRRQRDS